MSFKRRKMNKKGSRKYFKKNAVKVHKKNLINSNPMRGGIRL